jgi:hypothetical protein
LPTKIFTPASAHSPSDGSGIHQSKIGGVQIAPLGLFINESSIFKPSYFVSIVPAAYGVAAPSLGAIVNQIRRWSERHLVLCLMGTLILASCGGGGAVGGGTSGGGTSGGGTGGAISAPSGLHYGGNIVTEFGNPFGPYPPTVTGTVTTYSVSPALPAGLTLDPSTGVISGTPLKWAPETTYTITASNEAGATTIALNVAILVPPTALTYAGPVTLRVGTALIPVVPSLSGDADLFFPTLGLPPGLGLDPNTGILSGTPSRARVATTYIVTASNAGGAYTTAALTLAVDPPPAGTAVTGVFRSDTVIGLGYVSGTHDGLTENSGAFTYEQGRVLASRLGPWTLATVPTAKALVTPVDLVAQGTGTSNRVLNVERFLMMLDQDGNANNGIQIFAAVTEAAASWVPVDFDTTDLPTTLAPLKLPLGPIASRGCDSVGLVLRSDEPPTQGEGHGHQN